MQTIVNPYVKYSYARMYREAHALRRAYPAFIALGSAGRSVEGRELLYLRLGQGSGKLLMVGAHHAREYISSAYLMAQCELLARLADQRALVPWSMEKLLEKVSIFVLPMLNPDGVEISIRGEPAASPAARRMPKIHGNYSQWKANARGVDLNRHYPCLFDEKKTVVGAPASELFKGFAPATEPEVRALMEFCEAQAFDLAATFHAKGEEIFYADANTPQLTEQSRALAERLARLTGYTLAPVSQDPAVFGAGFENWFRAEYQRPCLLFELTPFEGGSEPHDMERFDTLVWRSMQWAGAVLAEWVMTHKVYNSTG